MYKEKTKSYALPEGKDIRMYTVNNDKNGENTRVVICIQFYEKEKWILKSSKSRMIELVIEPTGIVRFIPIENRIPGKFCFTIGKTYSLLKIAEKRILKLLMPFTGAYELKKDDTSYYIDLNDTMLIDETSFDVNYNSISTGKSSWNRKQETSDQKPFPKDLYPKGIPMVTEEVKGKQMTRIDYIASLKEVEEKYAEERSKRISTEGDLNFALDELSEANKKVSSLEKELNEIKKDIESSNKYNIAIKELAIKYIMEMIDNEESYNDIKAARAMMKHLFSE